MYLIPLQGFISFQSQFYFIPTQLFISLSFLLYFILTQLFISLSAQDNIFGVSLLAQSNIFGILLLFHCFPRAISLVFHCCFIACLGQYHWYFPMGCWGGHMTNYPKWSKNKNCSPTLYLSESGWIMLWSAPIVEIWCRRIWKVLHFFSFFAFFSMKKKPNNMISPHLES